MSTVLTILHLLVCGALIVIILLQAGKGAGMGAAFGGASQTLFGSTGRATFLTKITIAAGIIFGLTSLGLSFLGGAEQDIMRNYAPEAPAPKTDMPLPPSDLGAGVGIPASPDATGAGVGLPDVTQPGAPGASSPINIPISPGGEAAPSEAAPAPAAPETDAPANP